MEAVVEELEWNGLGSAIRERRLRRSLSLVDLALRADLSQPFLSQVENGRAHPSLLSLRRIAEALETTPQALFEGPVGAGPNPTVVRASEVRTVEIAEGAGTCRLLLAGENPLHLVEFDGLPAEFLDYFEHDGFEVIHVVGGTVEVDLAGDITSLEAGDSMTYPSSTPHRFRSVGTDRARALLFEAARVRRDHHVVAGNSGEII